MAGMKEDRKNVVVLDDDALDHAHGGTSEVPTMHPDVLLAKHQPDSESDPTAEALTGGISTPMISN